MKNLSTYISESFINESSSDYSAVERAIKKLGRPVETIKRSEGRILWKIASKDPNSKTTTEIGYVPAVKGKPAHYFRNTNSNKNALNSVWNHSQQNKIGPAGWYTFSEKDILDYLDNMKKHQAK